MRTPTQRSRVRKILEEHGTITNVQAVGMKILRLSERIRELQAEGMEITGDRVWVDDRATGTYRYTLENHAPKPKLVPIVIEKDGRRFVRMVEVSV